MNDKALNITNGDAFNKYFISKFGTKALPFCEAMMDGNTVLDIYSDEFVDVRSKELGVSREEYKSKMLTCGGVDVLEYEKLNLWFGRDTFCQMNLLTLLAYLEQIDYRGKITLNYIDDETFDVIESDIEIELGVYRELYKKVIMSKQRFDDVGCLYKKAIELYFDYHSENGALSKIARENSDMGENGLVCLLLEKSKEYGLSDIQARKIIERNKKL